MALAALLGLLPSAALAQSQPETTKVPAGQRKPAADENQADIVVTAQRRSERLIDVPYNVTAITPADVTKAGAINSNDLTKLVAGLQNFADGPTDRYGQNNFSMRGLNADPQYLSNKLTQSAVATYYGDTPIFFPVLMKDLSRIEVLRGPQGTLYGAGAEAGAIRFIPNRPQFDRLTGEVNASTGFTQHAPRPNGSIDGVINVPLARNLALRVSAAYVNQAGFIDAVDLFKLDSNGVPVTKVPGDLTSGPVVGPVKKATNSWEQWMVRNAIRYEPTDWLDLEVSYLRQHSHTNNAQKTNPDFRGGMVDLSDGTWPNGAFETRPGGKYADTNSLEQPMTSTVNLLSGTAAFDLGFAQLSSISSYYKNKLQSRTDLGAVNPDANFGAYYNFYPRLMENMGLWQHDKGFTQEVRLVSKAASRLSYVLGVYYSYQHKNNEFEFIAPGIYAFSAAACATGLPNCVLGANPQLGDLTGTVNQDFVTKEKALFGELTYHITHAWQVTGGIRLFTISQQFNNYSTSPYFGASAGDGVTEPVALGASFLDNHEKDTSKVFKVNTSYNLDADNKIYATFSQGFRRGGANFAPTTGPSASLPQYAGYKPDFADNYEVGIKGRTLDRKLTYTLDAYLINLRGFQFNAWTPSYYSAVYNGNKAVTKGVEFEGYYKATPQLTLSGSYVLTLTNIPKATIIHDLAPGALLDGFQPTDIIVNPNATVPAGTLLPAVSKHAATAAIDYELPLRGGGRVLLHGNAAYRSSQHNTITRDSYLFTILPPVFMADARITYDSGRGWLASVFVTNLTNSLGVIGTENSQTNNPPEPASLLYAGKIISTPRTFGVQFHYSF